jgi:DNA-binding transcriptional regulator YiaG
LELSVVRWVALKFPQRLKPEPISEAKARARAKEEADPCGMTTRKARATTKATIGVFATLRMTARNEQRQWERRRRACENLG